MSPAEAAAFLRRYNEWRRGELDDLSMPDPRVIGEAIDAAVEMIDRLEAAEKRTAKLEERCAVLTASLRLAVRQNNHDMLMTAEELRSCEAILEESK